MTTAPIVMDTSTEYRLSERVKLTEGDEVSVKGRRGRFIFREHVVKRSPHEDEYLLLTEGGIRHVFARPEHVKRKRKAALPKGAAPREGESFVRPPMETPDEMPDPVEDEPEVPSPDAASAAVDKPEPEVPEGHELRTCEECGASWTRPIVRGRKPKRCRDCR